jgi:hypothetical protein
MLHRRTCQRTPRQAYLKRATLIQEQQQMRFAALLSHALGAHRACFEFAHRVRLPTGPWRRGDDVDRPYSTPGRLPT